MRAARATQGRDFLVRRARREVRELPPATLRGVLSRVLEAVDGSGRRASSTECQLLEWAGHLEARGRLREAARVLDLAREDRPEDAELALHRARVSRTAGEERRAAALYRRVLDLDGDRGRLSRMARVGLALLSPTSEEELGRTLRRSLAAGDREAAAVAQEARARVRRRRDDAGGALRDYAVAALRFRDPTDRGRIAHEAADLLLEVGEPRAARRVLRVALETGDPEQAERARSRLRDVSRRQGDQVGVRRWRTGRRPSVGEPSTGDGGLRRDDDSGRALAERVARWLRRLSPESSREG